MHIIAILIRAARAHVSKRLLEDLAISVRVLLAADCDGLVPSPLVGNKRLVCLVLGVELGELVALEVGSHLEGWDSLLTADKECTLNNRVVGSSIDRGRAEKVLAAGLQAVKEATYSLLA